MKLLKKHLKTSVALALATASFAASAETVTIGTLNNGDMIRMKELSPAFEKANPDIKLEWVILEENILRQRLTNDIATKGGQFDIMLIGMYEAPIWGEKGWLEPMTDLPASYDIDDVFDSVKGGLSHDGTLYALPFYAESSMTMYRKDLFEKAGMEMPAQPTWDFMKEAAAKIHDPANEVYGACLRGKPGWGDNMAFITTVANSFGAQWFDEKWEPQFDTPEWKNALTFYVDLLSKYGPPGASANSFNENLSLMNAGKCGFWVDATVAGSFVTGKDSTVADKMAFAPAPSQVTEKGSGWLWSWALGIPKTSDAKDAAKKFATWATSKEYMALVAEKEGIANTPPGTRKSLYANPEYLKAASFAAMTLEQMNKANPQDSTLKKNPYTGVQFVAIPSFSGFAATVGQLFSGALAGDSSVDKALDEAQTVVTRQMKRDGYIK